MKTILTLVLALSAFSALAGEIKIMDRATYNLSWVSDIRAEFAVNPQMGRAWVNLVFSSTGEGPAQDDERVQVQGLSFNTTTNQIILDAEGVQTVCANVRFNIFGAKIKNTGKCTFKQKHYVTNVDNGYEVEQVERLKITMNY